MKKIVLPKHVKLIIDILEQNGFEGYAVGGCVRDCILGREPKDWDITTNALPPTAVIWSAQRPTRFIEDTYG